MQKIHQFIYDGLEKIVIPAQAGIQARRNQLKTLDSRLHRNDYGLFTKPSYMINFIYVFINRHGLERLFCKEF